MPSNVNNSCFNDNNILKKDYFKKKKKYQTLLDILEEREKYKLDNQSIEGIKDEQEIQEIIKQDKDNIDIKYNKRKSKLLKEEGDTNTSKKNYRKIKKQLYSWNNSYSNIDVFYNKKEKE